METAPYQRITSAIFHSATKCEKRIAPLIHGDTDQDRSIRKMLVFHEFVFFFDHLMDRAAFSKLGPDRRTKLQEIVLPIISGVAIDMFMQSVPVEKKKIMRSEFYEALNDAGSDYATASGWVSKENPMLGDSLLAKLGRRICNHTGGGFNPEVMVQVALAASDERHSNNLPELVEAVKGVIDDAIVVDCDPWDDP
jgi:hypothetical protein